MRQYMLVHRMAFIKSPVHGPYYFFVAFPFHIPLVHAQLEDGP